MSQQIPTLTRNGAVATAAAAVSCLSSEVSARDSPKRRSLPGNRETEDAAVSLDHNRPPRHVDATVLSAHSTSAELSADDAARPTSAERKPLQSDVNSRQTTNEDLLLAFPPTSTTTRIAAVEDGSSSSSTDRHAAVTPNRDESDGASPDGPPFSTSTERENVRAVSAALQRARDSEVIAFQCKLLAYREVVRLQLTCTALQCKTSDGVLDEYLSDFPIAESLSKESKNLMMQATAAYDGVLSKLDGKQKLEEAEEQLEKAEAKLKEAEVNLGKAKSEVKEAEAALEKAKTEISAAALAHCVPTAMSSGELRIASLSDGAIGEAQGMVELVGEIAQKLSSLGSIDMMQQTIAFVLACSSGVGKTFFSLAAAKLLNKSLNGLVGTLYLGFNTGMKLRDNEIEFLQQARSYESVQLVLLRRLLIQLECLLVWKQPPIASEDSPVEPFTFDTYGLQHMVRMEERFLASLPLLPKDSLSLEAATQKALELLAAVQRKYKLSHLMLVIDEGQKLDELISPHAFGQDPSSQESGARCALRWTRELQLETCKRNCGLLCFGLMTGIHPKTSLIDETNGTNHPLRHMPMTLADFEKLTKVALDNAMQPTASNCRALTNEEIHNVAAAVFPTARVLRLFQFDSLGKIVFPDKSEFLKCALERDVARVVVVGALTNIGVRDDGNWAQSVPSRWCSPLHRIPCPSYAMTAALLESEISTIRLPCLQIFFEFEAFVSTALSLLVMIRTAFSVSGSDFEKESSVLDHLFPDPEVREKMDIAFPTTMKHLAAFGPSYDAQQKHYPSSKHGAHDAAFAVADAAASSLATTPQPDTANGLAEMYKLHLDQLKARDSKHNTLLFRCGGSAPIDFVILHKKKSESELWQLTLADSKHTSNVSKTSSSTEMALKGDMVFRYLEHQLNKEYHVTLTWSRTVVLITDATCEAPVEEVRLPPTVDVKQQPESVTIVRLMPSTFKMGCVTEYLFALPYAADVVKSGLTVTKTEK